MEEAALHLFIRELDIASHFQALRSFLLTQQGDLFDVFLPEYLDQAASASVISSVDAQGIFEDALRVLGYDRSMKHHGRILFKVHEPVDTDLDGENALVVSCCAAWLNKTVRMHALLLV